ncbi:MAG: MlaD family protein [Lonepinella koalarum]|nr:MlaD family protein [Lonepinella koalarum]
MTNQQTPSTENKHINNAQIRHIKRISPFWLLPFIAFCIGAILFFQIVKEQGITIRITFNNGEGLVANKTQIRYQGLQIGVVKKVNFTEDLKQVLVEANIYPEAESVLRENTRFWLVKPSASLAGISGLDALVSGNYITLQPGGGDDKREFIAEIESPIAQLDEGDLLVRLKADDLGSISEGASVYFKKIPVGKVYDYRISKEDNSVEIQLLINKNYAHLVKEDSHFWNISGINADISLSGIQVNMDSLNAIVQGAVAFDSPKDSPKARQNQHYTLYPNLQAAKRGLEIEITLPNQPGLKAGKTEVFYQNIQVGILAELSAIEKTQEKMTGKLLLDPSMGDLLTQQSHIILHNKKFSLGNLTDLNNALRGQYFEIIAGEGEPSREFVVLSESELLLKDPSNLIITLTAPDTYGISAGQAVYSHNLPIGKVVSEQIQGENVQFKIAIEKQYRHLIYADTQFVAATNLDISFGIEGIRIAAANPEKWLQGGIRIINHKQQGKAQDQYPLFKDLNNAEAGITTQTLIPNITLKTNTLPSISEGSLVLYRQYEVGKILEIRPTEKQFEVDVFIYPKYQHLLTNKSLFWVESAAQIDITPKGISIQASPVARSLKGAISFDNSGSNKNQTLYENELKAKSAGQIITFTADNATNLSKGMPLRYMGLSVGEIETVLFEQKSHKILAKALINPNYMGLLAKEGSQFKVISPQISAGGIENLSSLLQPYIDVELGNGKPQTQFRLQDNSSSNNNKFVNGLPLILESDDATNLTTGSPIMYRGIEVGTIRQLELNSLGDRVLIHISIGKKYQHLVRQNSEFWVSSGYSAEMGWSGIEINTGSVQQLLKGGISFSTPSGTVVQPQANSGQRFLLQIKRPEQSKHWNQGAIPVQ